MEFDSIQKTEMIAEPHKISTIRKDKHVVSIDIRSRWYKDEPLVLPNQVQQAFYIQDAKLGDNWRIVQRIHHRHLWDLAEQEQPDMVHLSNTEFKGQIDAFQRHDSNGDATVLDYDDIDLNNLAREDIEPDIVDDDVLNGLKEHGFDVKDDSCDEEDDTLNQYSDDDVI
ncbi:hypothetical protein CDL12_12819 [Handroanthus impetiginosus]|uniref:DUF4216 domain-containing protein n=1 Tax=Handroanthus impetiginosus TaxID=429701 RepID=A0A2G9HAL9_9LAMI|nr:hypothetical protein CDL12_12819 [Handroanthus impetiginosus]